MVDSGQVAATAGHGGSVRTGCASASEANGQQLTWEADSESQGETEELKGTLKQDTVSYIF